jgi:hypothetical protein
LNASDNLLSRNFLEIFPTTYAEKYSKGFISTIKPAGFDKPELIAFNEPLSEEIGLGRFEEKISIFWLEITFLTMFRPMPQLMQDISLEMGRPTWRRKGHHCR